LCQPELLTFRFTPFFEDIGMKKLLLVALLAFAVIGGTSTVMTVNSQPAHACPNANC
jgi:hypothetical protein